MRQIILEDKIYELIEDYKDAFDIDTLKEKLTDYFSSYDYILGDWAYGKLRLKGFCKKGNPNFKEVNDFSNKDNYLKNNCAYDCKYFILEKIK